MKTMRAKMYVGDVSSKSFDPEGKIIAYETLEFNAVTEKPFDGEGYSEDNSFSKWTPSAKLSMMITNPDLFGKFKSGQKFYLDFTESQE